MRYLVTGVDAAGRSCVTSSREMACAELVPGLAADALFRTKHAPPAPRPEGRGDLVDLRVAPGQASWAMWRFDPGAEVGMHHTDTIDFDLVLDGSVDLVLDDGIHGLAAGDGVVMTGVDHGWRAGPEGCLMSGVALGSALRD